MTKSVHWVSDVVFGEEASRKRVFDAAGNYLRLMGLAVLNLLRTIRTLTAAKA